MPRLRIVLESGQDSRGREQLDQAAQVGETPLARASNALLRQEFRLTPIVLRLLSKSFSGMFKPWIGADGAGERASSMARHENAGQAASEVRVSVSTACRAPGSSLLRSFAHMLGSRSVRETSASALRCSTPDSAGANRANTRSTG